MCFAHPGKCSCVICCGVFPDCMPCVNCKCQRIDAHWSYADVGDCCHQGQISFVGCVCRLLYYVAPAVQHATGSTVVLQLAGGTSLSLCCCHRPSAPDVCWLLPCFVHSASHIVPTADHPAAVDVGAAGVLRGQGEISTRCQSCSWPRGTPPVQAWQAVIVI